MISNENALTLDVNLRLGGREQFMKDLADTMDSAGDLVRDGLGGALDQAGGRMMKTVEKTSRKLKNSLPVAPNCTAPAGFKYDLTQMDDMWDRTWLDMNRSLEIPLEGAGDLLEDSLGGAADQVGDRVLGSLKRSGREMNNHLSKALSGSFTSLIKGDLDQMDGIWDQLSQNMGHSVGGAFSGMLGSAGDLLDDSLDDYLDFLGDGVRGSLNQTGRDLNNSLSQALSGSVTAIFKGDLDEAGKVWELAWKNMGGSLEGMWGGLVDGLLQDLTGGFDSLLNKFVFDPVGGWLTQSFFPAGLSQSGSPGGSILNLLGLATAGGGSATATSTILGTGGAITGAASGAGALGAGMTGGVTLGGGAGLTGTTGLGAAAAGALLPAGAFLGGAAAFAGLGFGLAELTGIGTGGYTREEAQQAIAADQAYLQRAVDKQESWAGPEFLGRIQEAVTEMDRLAGTAGYTEEQIDAMVDSLSGWGSAMAEGGQAAGELELTLERMIRDFESQANSTRDMERTMEGFAGELSHLSGYLFDASDGVVDLGDTFGALLAEFEAGGITIEQLGEKLNQEVSLALSEAADQGSMTTEEMRKLSQAIKDIPKSWQSEVSVTKHETTVHTSVFKNINEHHSGGLVMHSGGLVPRRFHSGSLVGSLAWDEVPIIAQRGEYVVRAESVTASTLPGLKALNQSGGNAGPADRVVINSPLINIEGNLLGSDDNFEDLVRAVECKLREVAGVRQGA